MSLRPYQASAVKKMVWSLSVEGGSLVILPTGAGKTHVIAEFARKVDQPILILSPSKELLEQTHEKLLFVVDESQVGLYSASVGKKDIKKFTIATVQSAYKKPEDFSHFKIILIDECDLVSPKSEESMYSKLFAFMDSPKLIGLTASPWRMGIKYQRWGKHKFQVEAISVTQMINRHWKGIWKQVLTCVNTSDLIHEGYLSRIEYTDLSMVEHSQIPTNKTKSDFDLEAFDRLCNDYTKMARQIEALPHKSIIVYCSSIEQANALNQVSINSKVVTSKTKAKDRKSAIDDLKSGKLRVIYNVSVLSVGFDYPALEAIVLLRPTKSLRLYSQIVGRVGRKAPDKECGYVYDFVGNVKAMGKIEEIEIKKGDDGKWNVFSPTFPNGYHNTPLFTYRMKTPKTDYIVDDRWLL